VSAKPKLVVLLSRFPFPLIKGDKLRAYHQLKELSTTYDIYCFCISDEKVSAADKEEVSKFCKSLTIYRIYRLFSWANALRFFLSSRPAQVGYFYRNVIQFKFNKQLKLIQPDHLYCQLIRTAAYVSQYHGCKKTIDYMDALSKGIERRISLAKSYEKWIFKKEASNLVRFENLCFDFFDNHCIISEADQQCIYHPERNKIEIIRNGVDPSHFENLNVEKCWDVIFTGNMGYAANIEAVQFIEETLLPLLIKEKQDIKLLMVGASMPAAMVKRSTKNIEFKSFVPDIRSFIQSARTYLAPMTIGTGLQNKLLEAMAAGTPTVTTELCNTSLRATHNSTILLADSPSEMVTAILRLLKDSAFSDQLSENAKTFVKQNYSWKVESLKLVKIFSK
jgi:glycosyltransferase involved in cell wall biosynthesis